MTLRATVQALGALDVCATLAICTLYATDSTAQNTKLPFPDGTIIAPLHWEEVSSDENDKVLATGLGRRR
jgi:hypothetical protein